MNKYILKIQTEDKKGLIYHISKVLLKADVNIEHNNEYVDKENNQFFMRTVFISENEVTILEELKSILPKNSIITLNKYKKKDVVLMATLESHCIGDILLRYYSNEMDINIVAVISNYDKLENLVTKFDIPYYYIPVEGKSREEHENLILNTLSSIEKNIKLDYILLAKYMRVLTPNFVSKYQFINIHHSFLPSFIGANPYRKAFDRGVKIIGATAHYVTNDLDEGPIIIQEVLHVDHTYTADTLKEVGKNVEKIAFAKAIDLVIHDKVFVYQNKTIIL